MTIESGHIDDDDLYLLNGCVPVMQGGERTIYGGWSPTPEELLASIAVPHDPNEAVDLPDITGDFVFLWEFIYAAAKRGDNTLPVHNGYWPMNWQLTGSCVKGGFENAMKVATAVDVVCRPEPEAVVEPFVFPCYGESRYRLNGNAAEGSGSSGGYIAAAAAEIGIPPMDDPDAVKPHLCGPAQVWDAAVELHWSSRRAITPGMAERSKRHAIKYVRVRNADEAERELRRRRPLTFCGNWGGQTNGVVRGTKAPILTMPHSGSWSHQQSCLGVWANHPDFGDRRWRIQNQWWQQGTTKVEIRNRSITRILQPGIAEPMHGADPTIEGWTRPPIMPGGYWVTDEDMNYQCSRGEVIAIVSFTGYDGREISLGSI